MKVTKFMAITFIKHFKLKLFQKKYFYSSAENERVIFMKI